MSTSPASARWSGIDRANVTCPLVLRCGPRSAPSNTTSHAAPDGEASRRRSLRGTPVHRASETAPTPHCKPAVFGWYSLRRWPAHSSTTECAGHRRSEYQPNTAGLQWGVGAVSEARWTGVPLSDLLREASPSGAACEVVFEGADRGPHRSTSGQVTFARSIPLQRALAGDVLIAWEMNGHPLPAKHGAPLRLVVPGSYAVASVKWLRLITVLEQSFAGPFQTDDYQINGEPLDGLKVNSLIIKPGDRSAVPAGTTEVAGVAWGGQGGIAAVEIRRSGGPWQHAVLDIPRQNSALHHWSARLELPPGEHHVKV